MNLLFCCFFLSGFCSLVYQVVWLRLAMANFGVTTASVSIVLSVFMAGLALGSFGGGRLVRRFENRSGAFFIGLYGAAELAIGISGLTVAPLLRSGHMLLANHTEHANWGSVGYYFASGSWVALVMLPFCTCMGATFPLMMAGIRARFRAESLTSFSFLYLGNVIGAMTGALVSAFVLIELMGFSKTLLVTAGLNGLVAVAAFIVASAGRPSNSSLAPLRDSEDASLPSSPDRIILPLLFISGFSSLGMEVVWSRQFIPFLGPVVYSFATMLAVYLGATFLGSRVYRSRIRHASLETSSLFIRGAAVVAGCCALAPLLTADPRINIRQTLVTGALRIAWGVGPFCGLLGFLTPMLVDRWSSGDPNQAGKAYAVNAVGCIVGPLLSGFVLLPLIGERWTLVLFSFPFFVLGLLRLPPPDSTAKEAPRRWLAYAGSASIALVLITMTKDFDNLFPRASVRRDHTATVIAVGEGMERMLLVNGIGITRLTPITKMMAHLPLAFLASRPRNILVLCFGMGTSFRSALSWGVPVTVVELVPSVPSLFAYFHNDGDQLLRSPRATVVIDDARRFLERAHDTYDVIIIDPPPPVEAAGSSLLYSAEFYETARTRLSPHGILQQWLPEGEPIVVSAFARSLGQSFADVRVFGSASIKGWGLHFLASSWPITKLTARALAARVPPQAVRDLLEWDPGTTVESQLQTVMDRELPLKTLIDKDPHAPILTDDRPVNEYYFLRRRQRTSDSVRN